MTEPRADGASSDGASASPRRVPAPTDAPRLWLADLSIRQPVFITMVVLAAMVVGGIFYSRMGLDLLPDITLPVVVVQTVYPGASPEEVERSVTRPIEEAVSSINGVETVRSISEDSLSRVIVEFDMNADGKEAADEVRARLNLVRNSLPDDATEPMILRFDPSAAPIVAFAVADTSGRLPPEQLRTFADDTVKPRIERIAGVAAAAVSGGRVREVQVALDASRLEAYGIPPQQVVQAIRTENLDIPAGRVQSGDREELLRVVGQVRSLADLAALPVASRPNGVAIRLEDVATIVDGYAEQRILSRLDGRESVVVSVRKQSGTNTVQVADAVKRELEQLRREYPDLSFAVAFDQSTFTRAAVEDIQVALVLGALLAAVVVLLFFRDLRNTLVTVAGLPVIVLGTFAVLHVLGLSLNMITLMALSLSVGMLIDDAIVVRENIFRHMEQGEEPRIAASRGTGEIALAVLAVTSTIVAVFLPVAFTEGIAGKYLRDFGITVAVAVLISLIEAFTLAPMLSAYFFKRIDPQLAGEGRAAWFDRIYARLNQGYRLALGWSLRHRLPVVLVGLVALAISLAILPRMVLAFIPETDQGQFAFGLELAPGARLTETDRAARAAERIIMADPAVGHVFTTVGSDAGTVEKATLNVRLHERGRTEEAIARLRPQLDRALPGVKLSVDRQSTAALFAGSTALGAIRTRPIQFAVEGQDFSLLDRTSAELVARLRQVPGLVDVDRSIKAGPPGQAIVLDRQKAADLGVSAAQVGTTVRALVNGEVAGTYRDGDQDVDVLVRLRDADRDSRADILRLPLVTPRGAQLPLSAVASLVESTEPGQIYRENRQRQVVVGASYLGRDLGAVTADARRVAESLDLPPGVTVKVSGIARYQDEAFASLGFALGLAVLFVYMILASQFGSFVHPFTIMLALPFSVIGALLALYLGGFNFDMLGMIGIILLMGLVTKNSILLVEFINQLRRRGLAVHAAILEAGPIRLRPILMTTLAMIFGMVPVAVGVGAGSELRRPMGVSVIGGLITSTLLTLIVVPVAYSLIDDLSRLLRGRRTPAPGRADGVAQAEGAPAATARRS